MSRKCHASKGRILTGSRPWDQTQLHSDGYLYREGGAGPTLDRVFRKGPRLSLMPRGRYVLVPVLELLEKRREETRERFGEKALEPAAVPGPGVVDWSDEGIQHWLAYQQLLAAAKDYDHWFSTCPTAIAPAGFVYTEKQLSEKGISIEVPTTEPDTAGLLQRFIRLAGKEDDALVDFANSYGSLEQREGTGFSSTGPGPRLSVIEPVELWRAYSRGLGATLNVAARLWREEAGASSQEWTAIAEMIGHDLHLSAEVQQERSRLGYVIQTLLNRGGILVDYEWSHGPGPSLELRGGGLLGFLAREVAFTVAKAEGLDLCAGCGEAFQPTVKRKRSGLSWCDGEECQRARSAYSSRRNRRKAKSR